MPAAKPRVVWDAPLTCLPGIGPRRADQIAAAFGPETVGALLQILPRRFEDPPQAHDLGALADPARVEEGARVLVEAEVVRASLWRRGGRSTLRVLLDDGCGRAEALYFGQPYLRDAFPVGRRVRLEGRLSRRRGVALLAPRMAAGADDDAPEGTATEQAPRPVYPEAEGVPGGILRRAIAAALPLLDDLEDPLPEALRRAAAVPPLGAALADLHRPRDADAVERARRRLAWGEVVALERRRRAATTKETRAGLRLGDATWKRIFSRIPFTLTEEQQAVLAVLRADLESGRPMRRLLHGEVGSGKTAVAFALLLAATAGGLQSVLLAPTEILARQHAAVLGDWLRGSRVRVAALFGDDSAAARRRSEEALAGGAAQVAVGTHALLGPRVRFRNLGLVVFDEQHRFGVRQKAALTAKGRHPHVLTMTATPIPRTLAWARHGALEPVTLRTRPGSGGRTTTVLHPLAAWSEVAEELRARVAAGERAFVVVPRIDGDGGLAHWQHALFEEGPWRGLPHVVVHGRLDGGVVAERVAALRAGSASALIGTSVVEVGLDVPDVRHMLVLGADRFGLASLHQLRGRLGRGPGAGAARCHLLAEADALARLEVLARCDDGFRIADADLAERGPGELHGTRQHGAGGFQVFDPARDGDLVALLAREDVRNLLGGTG